MNLVLSYNKIDFYHKNVFIKFSLLTERFINIV